MRGKALNAKYSVSLCLPFPSGTLPPPELFSTDLEDELEQLQQFIWILTLKRMVFKNSLNHFAVYFFSQVVHIPFFPSLIQYLDYAGNLRKSRWKVNK